MANLQANLRSQYAMAQWTTSRASGKIAYFSRAPTKTATPRCSSLIMMTTLGCWRYAGLAARPASRGNAQSGSPIEWLNSTSTVLGLFEEVPIQIAEVQLYPGDTFVLYTDGVTEAENPQGEEFGEARLVEVLRGCAAQTASELTQTVCSEVSGLVRVNSSTTSRWLWRAATSNMRPATWEPAWFHPPMPKVFPQRSTRIPSAPWRDSRADCDHQESAGAA